MNGIKKKAKMAALAMPLWCFVPENHPDRLSYSVITNYWKERDMNGDYELPGLDPSLYL